jgi:hypothetical protein
VEETLKNMKSRVDPNCPDDAAYILPPNYRG